MIREHIDSLACPLDSWLEDRLFESEIAALYYGDLYIGYAAVILDTLQFFYVSKPYFCFAPQMLETVITAKALKNVFVTTQDTMLNALICEWDYDKKMQACWFTGGGTIKKPPSAALFRAAEAGDAQAIRNVSGEFFDEESGGFASLEERIAAGTVFVLEDGALLGCGVLEKGRFCPGVVSIGMFTNRQFRKKGAARTILIRLKEMALENGLQPVAGCWYYNTLSRKSLESAGMIAAAKGYTAILKGKGKLPLRTGNPPGELAE